MGRIDQMYFAADGQATELLHHDWLLLVVLTAATLALYYVASRRDRGRREAG